MKILKLIILGLLILMSLAAGAAKVMQMPQEVKFFEDIGLSLGLVMPFGVLQPDMPRGPAVLAGAFALWKSARV